MDNDSGQDARAHVAGHSAPRLVRSSPWRSIFRSLLTPALTICSLSLVTSAAITAEVATGFAMPITAKGAKAGVEHSPPLPSKPPSMACTPKPAAISKSPIATSAPGMPWHQFQETILFNQPGTRVEDNVEWGALSVANMENQSYTYMWGKDAEMDKSKLPEIKSPNIQMTNLKSQYKPYIIFEPGVSIDPWLRKEFFHWNHWPVAQLPRDGRVSHAVDRPSHMPLSCGAPILHHDEENNSHMAVMLYGLKKGKVDDLAPLARSWNYPAELKVIAGDITSMGYERYERTYILECENNSNKAELQLKGSARTPVVNPAIVIRNWGVNEVKVKLNGVDQVKMKDFRAGYEKKIDRTDLILWFKTEIDKDINITIESQN